MKNQRGEFLPAFFLHLFHDKEITSRHSALTDGNVNRQLHESNEAIPDKKNNREKL